MTSAAELPKELAFSTEEYRERYRRLRALMAEAALDVMLVHQPPSVFYFSGYENLHVYDNECVVIPLEGEISLLVDEADRVGILRRAGGPWPWRPRRSRSRRIAKSTSPAARACNP